MATLLAIRGPLTGTRIQINDEPFLIGRSGKASLNLQDATVSRIHAAVRKHRMGFVLEDTGSSTGTFLNNREVTGPVVLAPNDEIRIGHTIFLFDSPFDLQNADFTDNSVFFASANDETVSLAPVATLDAQRDVSNSKDEEVRLGLEFVGEIGNLFDGSKVPLGEAIQSTMTRLARLFKSDVALLLLHNEGQGELRVAAAIAKGDVIADSSILRHVYNKKKSLLISDKPTLAPHPASTAPRHPTVRSVIASPLLVDDLGLGVVSFERQELDAYTLKELRILQSVAKLLAVFIDTRRRAEAVTLRLNYQSIDSPVVGSSPAFKRTMDIIQKVAQTPATVLFIGETGTGKEILAAETHRLSRQGREGRPFIAVNCAAIPESLFESELFGHEKGSFTGAFKMHQGYIEKAHGGTLFLDEIGELSPTVQPKLLRFLQEHTFTRVGGTRVHRAEVRVIAATNRDLSREVEVGRFREDLYHRLAILPIEIPPLRERQEDIKDLLDHFVKRFAKMFHKNIEGVDEEALELLKSYAWPGNVRELANCAERAVLLCEDTILQPRHFHLGTTLKQKEPTLVLPKPSMNAVITPLFRSLEEVQREHILKVLKAVDFNQAKAAEILKIHRNTLRNKLQEYGGN